MKLQFVTGIHAMLTYLTSYLCKPKHTMSERMQKASKEAYEKVLKIKCFLLVIHQKSAIFTYEAFKYRCSVSFYRSKKE